MEDYIVDLELVKGHKIFDDLLEADRVVLMASARFPGLQAEIQDSVYPAATILKSNYFYNDMRI